jgi:hypothetical protein
MQTNAIFTYRDWGEKVKMQASKSEMSGDLKIGFLNSHLLKKGAVGKSKTLTPSDRKFLARRIAKAAKTIWNCADDAEFSKIRYLSEMLFYEAYLTASGNLDVEKF